MSVENGYTPDPEEVLADVGTVVSQRMTRRKFFGLPDEIDEEAPEMDAGLPRLTPRERAILGIVSSPAVRWGFTLLALALLTKDQANAPTEITIVKGALVITPNNLRFRTSPTAVEGDQVRNNVVPHNQIFLEGAKKPSLDMVDQFTLSNAEAVQGPDSDKFVVNGQIIQDSPYWIKIPGVQITDPKNPNKQIRQNLYVGLNAFTQDNIQNNGELLVVQNWRTGIFNGQEKVADRNRLGRVSDFVYKPVTL